MVRNITRFVSALGLTALLVAPAAAQTVNDTALFTAAVPPNVMLLVDNSGSMNEVVWHPMPTIRPAKPTCTTSATVTTYFVPSHGR